ncbi:MAG: F0F1 ATP synthase subunit delta [Gammaproteobacteria bacterium]|nr:F0F1 ATP synthase subunit delta [Gammaproteobacteria bacterium]
MADARTIARPYAKAVFDVAATQDRFEEWGELLAGLSQAVATEAVDNALENPKFGSEKVAAVIIETLEGRIDNEGRNFVRVLAEYDRLDVLPEICERFETLRAEAERTIDVEVVSAAPMSDTHQHELVNSLRRRLGREVRLQTSIDPSLIGGAIIRAGDLVIDGSLRGRLDQLATAVKA